MNIILIHPDECARPLPRNDYRARHLLHTLRAQDGDTYKAGIVNGAMGEMLIERITDQGIQFRFIPSETEVAPPLLPFALIIGHPRPLVTKRLVADLSSIGVAAIHFFIGENSEKSYLKSNIWRDGILKRMCIEGAEQSGTTAIPSLHHHASLAHALRAADAYDTEEQQRQGRRVMAMAHAEQHSEEGIQAHLRPAVERQYLTLPNEPLSLAALPGSSEVPLFITPTEGMCTAGAGTIADAGSGNGSGETGAGGGSAPSAEGSTATSTATDSKAMIIAVGAERGWTEREIHALHRYHYQPRTFGPRILRTATAAIAVSILAAQRYSVAVDNDKK